MEMIDSMAMAIKKFEGGVVLISHDFRLLSQVAEEIWVVDKGVRKWPGDIRCVAGRRCRCLRAGSIAAAVRAAARGA
jgi:ATPase subunit of ABC transporter with duplicated ATPase domains